MGVLVSSATPPSHAAVARNGIRQRKKKMCSAAIKIWNSSFPLFLASSVGRFNSIKQGREEGKTKNGRRANRHEGRENYPQHTSERCISRKKKSIPFSDIDTYIYYKRQRRNDKYSSAIQAIQRGRQETNIQWSCDATQRKRKK